MRSMMYFDVLYCTYSMSNEQYSIFSVYCLRTVLYIPIAAYKRYLHQRGILRRERAPHGHRNHGATAAYLFHHLNTFHASDIK
jgi:hypothetical protein